MPSTPEPSASQGSRDVGAASDECRKNASKNRKENDWFGHDATTAPTGSRSSTTSGSTSGNDSRPRSAASAPRTPNRTARESEDWFRYDVNGTQKTTTSGSGGSGPDVTSAKLRVLHGTQQDWYKHGSDVPDPPSMERQSKTRSRKSACAESRHKGTDPNEWFRHDHARGSSGTGTVPGSGSSRPSKKPAKDVASPTSLWVVYSEDGSPVNPSDATPRTRSRLTATEADEYYRRDKVGSSADWFSHDHPRDETPTSVSGQTSRMRGSVEGGEIADRLKGESEDWFSHDGNRNYVSPLPVGKGHSPLARELMERAQGSEIRQVFHMEENLRATWNAPPPLLGPDVDDVVQVQGSSSTNDDRDVENVREAMEKTMSNGQSKKKKEEEEEKTTH